MQMPLFIHFRLQFWFYLMFKLKIEKLVVWGKNGDTSI